MKLNELTKYPKFQVAISRLDCIVAQLNITIDSTIPPLFTPVFSLFKTIFWKNSFCFFGTSGASGLKETSSITTKIYAACTFYVYDII